jgi:hypothetical protein
MADPMSIKDFTAKYGEDSIPKALGTYHAQRQRSTQWREGSSKKAKAFDTLIAKSANDPKLKELLKGYGVVV